MPLNDAPFSSSQNQSDDHGPSTRRIILSLDDALEACKELYEYLESSVNNIDRDGFRQIAANVRYYHSIIIKDIGRLEENGVDEQVHGMHRDQLLDSLQMWEQQVLQSDYLNTCWCMLYDVERKWDYAISPLFIVLPSWNPDVEGNPDPAIYQFRLYFMCSIWKRNDSLEVMPQHIHLANHPGYNLNRPHEFFQAYGDYVLRMLRMVKHGYHDNNFEIPPLDTRKLLWGYNTGVADGQLSHDTIESLVDKAIEYLQELSPPRWMTNLGLLRTQSATIKTHLVVQDGDNPEGDLYRYIDHSQSVYGICQEHERQYFDASCLESLKAFVYGQGGHIDMQQATLGVQICSEAEACRFLSLLTSCRCAFNISIKLNWNAEKSYIEDLCLEIGKTNTVVLELDGITLDTHPQDHVQCMTDIFADVILRQTNIQCIRLLNYPRAREQRLYIGIYGLPLKCPSTQPDYNWLDLRSDLTKFSDTVSSAPTASECRIAARELQAALVGHGCPKVNVITIYSGEWDGLFDLNEGAFLEIHSFSQGIPKATISSSSFRSLTQDLFDVEADEELYQFVHLNSGLRELNISTHGRNVLFQLEDICALRSKSPGPLRLTLLELLDYSLGRIVAQVVVGAQARDSGASGALKTDAFDPQPVRAAQGQEEAQVVFQILQWDCDNICFPLSDFYASFVDMATKQYPSVLTSFTLDTTSLSAMGLTCIGNILRRSNLEYLHIKCIPFDSVLADTMAQVLSSVQLSTIKSLSLTGDRIDDWIRVTTGFVGPNQLLCLDIQGTGSAVHQLSHDSALFLHRLVCSSPLAMLRLQNVCLRDTRDWELIINAIDYTMINTITLLGRIVAWPTSAKDVFGYLAGGFWLDTVI